MIESIVHRTNGLPTQSTVNLLQLGVVLVDMQSGFLRHIAREEQDMMFSSQAEVLETCARRDYPVAVLEYDGCGATDERLSKFLQSVPRSALVRKNCNDGFSNPDLLRRLNGWDVSYLCFMGISAAHCVKATASSAIRNGKKVLTARQLIASQTFNQYEFCECIPWFERNGIYAHQYTTLVDLMQKKVIEDMLCEESNPFCHNQ